MILKKGNTILYRSMIAVSLLCLAAFLLFWLNADYQNEKSHLRQEVNYAIKDVVRALEDSLVHNVLLANVRVDTVKSGGPWKQITKKHITAETLQVKFEAGKIMDIKGDESQERRIFIEHTSENLNAPNGNLLSMLINWEIDEIKDSVKLRQYNSEVVDLLVEGMGRTFSKRGLPGDYVIDDTDWEAPLSDFSFEFYNNPFKKLAHVVEIRNYRGYILSRMTSNIILAVFLFTMIAVSFYLIYKNWLRQQELVGIKNEFISNVTHELKTPISTVSVALEALSDFNVLEDKERSKEYLDISQKELGRLGMLVDKVLKMSIFEKGESRLLIEEVDVKTLVEDIVKSMKLQFDKYEASVHTELDQDECLVQGDRVHLTNIIYNLVDNAIKYGGGSPRVGISLHEEDRNVILSVEDEGLGIAQEDQEKIFDRFFRIRKGDRHDIKGHGLGLSYVRSIVEQHGGSIKVESVLGEGSKFIVTLPKSGSNG